MKEDVITKGPHISIKPETVFHVFGFEVTNSLALSFIVFLFFILVTAFFTLELRRKKRSGFFYFIIFSLRAMYSLFESVFGEKTKYFFPLVGSFFFFILLQNWFGLLPGVGSILIKVAEDHRVHLVPLLRGNSADLNATLALALISVVYIQYLGIKHQGGGYLKKFINFANPIAFFIGILEIISEFSRIISFSFRLFGNIFAGEVLLTVIGFLVPVLASFPFLVFEVFIGVIQALVFSLLSAVLFRLAMIKDH